MFHHVRRLCFPAVLLCAATLAAPAAAQQQNPHEAQLQIMDESLQPVSPDLLVFRDGQGLIIQPIVDENGMLKFVGAGQKLLIEPTSKGAKVQSIELLLERGPKVFVSMIMDPRTGRVKQIEQKAGYPRLRPKMRATRGIDLGLSGVPSNDSCSSPSPIGLGATAIDNVLATTDVGIPGCATTGADIWYDYLAGASGSLTVSTCNTATFDTVLSIHNGLACPPAAPLACNDTGAGCAGDTSTITTAVTAGNHYLIRVAGWNGAMGTGTVNLSFMGGGGGPANDECAGATLVTCGSSTTQDNTAATTAGTDPAYSCRFGSPGQGFHTLWYKFVAAGPNVSLSTDNSVVTDTMLALYDGSCGALVELACNDDISGANFQSLIVYNGLTPGNTYYVQLAGFGNGNVGSVTLDIECVVGPQAGDACEDAIEIPCDGQESVNTAGFATDASDPVYSCRFGAPAQGFGTAWFKFTATDTSAKVDSLQSGIVDTMLAVYDGTCGTFTEIACNDDAPGTLRSSLCVEGLTVGVTYFIQASGFGVSDVGDMTVAIECPCPAPPGNDDCEDAEALVLPTSVIVDNTLATDDFAGTCGGPAGAPHKNVWYSVAGTGTTLTASTCNAGTAVTDTVISVFCADCGDLVCVAGDDDTCPGGGPLFASTVSWCSQVGANYLVTVGTWSAGTAPGIIQLDVFDTGSNCVADVVCLPQGACCLADGSCVVTTDDDCVAQGGTYQGDATACNSEFVADGSFEAGPFGGVWTEFSTNFGTPLCDVGACGPGGSAMPANSGDFWCWFGGIGTFEEGSVEQALTIPVGATTLDFALEIPVSSGNGVDVMRVKIDGTTLLTVFEDDPTYGNPGYDAISLPLGAFADGGVHTLRFESTQTGAGGAVTNFFVDDVSIAVQTTTCIACYTLDFETEDDFVTPLGDGQVIDTEFGNLVTITSAGANAGAGIFDGDVAGPNDPSQDVDLLVNLGNMLILQNSQVPGQTGGFFNSPNDDQDGGDLIFTMTSPVEAISLVLVDIDVGLSQASSVVLTDVGGKTRTYTVPTQWTEDLIINGPTGWRTLDLTTLAAQPGFASSATAVEDVGYDGTQVVTIKVHLGSSGAVDDVMFCQ